MSGNTTIYQPSAQFNIVPAQEAAKNNPQKALIVAQKLPTGSVIGGVLTENVSTSKNDINALFGAGSMASAAALKFRDVNSASQLDVIALDDGVGVPAASLLSLVGSATISGVITVDIGSARNNSYDVSVAAGDTIIVAGDALIALINADASAPVTAANAGGAVTITSKHDGIEYNDLPIRIKITDTDMKATATAFGGGTTNPTVIGVFDTVGDNRYQTVIWPDSYGLAELKTFLDPRFNAGTQILDGVGVVTKTGTYSELLAYGAAENSQSVLINGNTIVADSAHAGNAIVEIGIVQSAYIGAIRALRLTASANISQFVNSSGGAKDSFGGPHMASYPYFNTPYSNLPLIPAGKGFDQLEIEGLQAAGISLLGNNKAGNGIIAGEQVTTYKTDSAGNSDVSFKYLNYVDTSSNVREYMQNNFQKRFAQSRLTEGDLIEGHSMANEGIIRAYANTLYDTLSDTGFVLTQAGVQAKKFFNDNLFITLTMSEGKVEMNMKVPIVTQLREILATIQISFTAEG